MKKVLIAAPVAGTKQYSMGVWLNWIANQNHKEFEVAMCVNGKEKDEVIEMLKKTSIVSKYGDTKTIKILKLEADEKLTTIQRITYAREKLRRFAVKEKYDYLFFSDTDTIPLTYDTIKILMCEDVVSGVYFYKNSKVPVVIDKDTRTNISLEKMRQAYEEKKLVEVWGFGFGVLMLPYSVFSKCEFDYDLFGEERTDDFGYCSVLEKNKIKRFLNPKVMCQHLGTVDFNKLNKMTKINFQDEAR